MQTVYLFVRVDLVIKSLIILCVTCSPSMYNLMSVAVLSSGISFLKFEDISVVITVDTKFLAVDVWGD